MRQIWDDVRFGVRMLAKHRSATIPALLALALGVGANTALFGVVDTVLLRPLPYPEPDRLVWFWESQPNLTEAPFSAADFLDYRDQNRSFEGVAALRRLSFNLTGRGPAERLPGMVVTTNALDVLRVRPILGRSFEPADGRPGAARVALLTYGLWQSHFGGDPSVVGRSITLNSIPVVIIGVLPASFTYGGRDVQLWLNPRDGVPEVFPTWDQPIRTNRRTHYLSVLGRLKSGTSFAHAQADVDRIVAVLHAQYPETTGHTVRLVPLQEVGARPIRPTLLVVAAVVGFVLLIACANVANLLLARAAARRKEIAIRIALGGGRLRIVQQLLTESTVLALLGGGLGLALASALLRAVVAAKPADLPRVQEIGVDARVVVFALGASVATALLFGLAPALTASRQQLGDVLKESVRGAAAGAGHRRLRAGIVVAEIAFSMVLLAGAGLLTRSFIRLLDVNAGFNPGRSVTMWMNFTGARYVSARARQDFVRELADRIRALADTQAIAIANDLPLEGDDTTTGLSTVDGRRRFPRGQELLVGMHAVNAGYFQAMGIARLRGREFRDSDTESSTPVVIVNQQLADALWSGEDPIGKHITLVGDRPSEVVGVVGNVLHNGMASRPSFETYVPFRQNAWSYIALTIRTPRDPAAVYAAVRDIVSRLDRELPVHDMRTMDAVIADTLASRRQTMWVVSGFATLALLLAAIGLYGVMSYAVAERVHEIGVRVALGAQPKNVVWLVVRNGLSLAAAGLALGAGGALLITRAMAGLLYMVRPTDSATYVAVSALLAVVALAASYIPARRAATVDPLVALRHE
jgi:putative ABC transport system permease protein